MSSSSSAPRGPGPIAALLAESFEALAAELPAAHARMCARLAGKVVELCIDDERFAAIFSEGRARVLAADDAPAADVRVVTSRRAILAVLDARRSLTDAVLADEVAVVGALEHLVEAYAGLTAYLHGAVRSRSFAGLLRRFREVGAPTPARPGGGPPAGGAG